MSDPRKLADTIAAGIGDALTSEEQEAAMAALDALVGEPDYRAELAELRAQVRYLADSFEVSGGNPSAEFVAKQLRGLVGPWPHEKAAAGPCPHARPTWRMCPHCLGLNEKAAGSEEA